MNKAYVSNILGKLLLLLAAILIVPIVVALVREPEFDNIGRHVGLHIIHVVFGVLIVACITIPATRRRGRGMTRRAVSLFVLRGILLAGLLASFFYSFLIVKAPDVGLAEI